jgi:streptogramin lyase
MIIVAATAGFLLANLGLAAGPTDPVADHEPQCLFSASGYSMRAYAGTKNTFGRKNGIGPAAEFSGAIRCLTMDRLTGEIYAADTFNQMIRKVTVAGVVHTVALNFPGRAVAVDCAGTVYVASDCAVYKVSSSGAVLFVGSAVKGYLDGRGAAARFDRLRGLVADSSGKLYATDAGNGVVRGITQDGVVTTLAGQAGNTGKSDGQRSDAHFSVLGSLTLEAATGNIYVSDAGNLRLVTATGEVTTLASGMAEQVAVGGQGTIYSAGDGSAVLAYYPKGRAYRYPYEEGAVIGRTLAAGSVVEFAGVGNATGMVDGGITYGVGYGDGSTGISTARLSNPGSLTVDGWGNVYVLDQTGTRIRKIDPLGGVCTVANYLTKGATSIAINPGGDTLYVCGAGPNYLQRIKLTSRVTTVASRTDGIGYPDGVAVIGPVLYTAGKSGTGNLTESGLWKYGLAAEGGGVESGTKIVAHRVNGIRSWLGGIAADASGNCFITVADETPGMEPGVYAIGTQASVSRIAVGGAPSASLSLTSNNLYYLSVTGNALASHGAVVGVQRGSFLPGGGALSSALGGVYVDPLERLYATDMPSSLEGRPAVTLLGSRVWSSKTIPTGTLLARGVCADASGAVYVSGEHDGTISKIVPVTLMVTVGPESQSCVLGEAVTLEVKATGVPSPSYQWFKDGVPIQDARYSVFGIAALTAADVGSYTCRVSNLAGDYSTLAAQVGLRPGSAP